MGCWNATCNISNLPIYWGDEVVLIPLIQTTSESRFNTCYATDAFVPFAFPLFGKYNDYGAIEEITTIPENEKLIRSFDYYRKGRDDEEEPYVKLKSHEDFELFVSQNLCCCGGVYIKTNCANHTDGMAELNFFMAHRKLYDAVLAEAGNRIPYDRDSNYRDLLTKKIDRHISECLEDVERCEKTKKELIELGHEEKAKLMSEMMLNFDLDRCTEKVFCFGEMLSPTRRWWRDMLQDYLGSRNQDIIRFAVDKIVFTFALNALRKGYLCDSGAGSQSQETAMHYLVAQFVINHLREYAEKVNAECIEECTLPTGVEEEIFFSD